MPLLDPPHPRWTHLVNTTVQPMPPPRSTHRPTCTHRHRTASTLHDWPKRTGPRPTMYRPRRRFLATPAEPDRPCQTDDPRRSETRRSLPCLADEPSRDCTCLPDSPCPRVTYQSFSTTPNTPELIAPGRLVPPLLAWAQPCRIKPAPTHQPRSQRAIRAPTPTAPPRRRIACPRYPARRPMPGQARIAPHQSASARPDHPSPHPP